MKLQHLDDENLGAEERLKAGAPAVLQGDAGAQDIPLCNEMSLGRQGRVCNEMSLGRQGRVSAEARVRSGRLRQGAAAAMALAPGQAGPRERGGTRSLRIPRNAPCCATRYSR